ncbi:SAM-dependent methyltransferase [Mycobacterium sp. NPDC003449]
MSAQPLPETLAGAPLTAVGVAVIRARETERDDRLYSDPYARLFVEAAERAYLDPTAPAGSAETWASVRRLAEVMYENRTFGVRITDDGLLRAAAEGRTQIVLLGAGLDTHAFRLPWPRPVQLFEIDLPALFAFKEPVLARTGAKPVCARHVIPADLSADEWPNALVDSGFQPGIATHWVDHALMTLPVDTARAGVRALTELSAPGSRYGFPVMPRDGYRKTLRSVDGAEDLYRGVPNIERGLGEDAREWLEGIGWTTTFQPTSELIRDYPRAPRADPGGGTVIATRS